MSSATQPRPVIHEAVMKLGAQRGQPRWYANARYLERAGFRKGTWIELVPGPGSLTVRKVTHPTGKRVQEKRSAPLIDLNSQMLAEVFGETERLYVRVERDQIVLSVHPLDARQAERPRDGSMGSVFSGVGMLDQAGVDAGFRSAWAVEINDRTAEYFSMNHPDAVMYEMSAHEAAFADLPSTELLLMGVPCQPWSRNRTTRGGERIAADAVATEHELGDMAWWALMILARVNPRTVVIENVEGFLGSETGVAFQKAIRRLGYHVQSRVLNAGEHGHLSHRKRAVIVAQTPEADGSVRDPWPATRRCTSRIADVLDKHVPDSEWWDRTTHPNRFERSDRNRAKGSGRVIRGVEADARKLGTLTAEYGNVKLDEPLLAHPTRPETYRWFTLTEGRRIMGLPETFALPEQKGPGWRLLGQGVVVGLFTEVIARATGRHAAARVVGPDGAGAVDADPWTEGLPLFDAA